MAVPGALYTLLIRGRSRRVGVAIAVVCQTILVGLPEVQRMDQGVEVVVEQAPQWGDVVICGFKLGEEEVEVLVEQAIQAILEIQDLLQTQHHLIAYR